MGLKVLMITPYPLEPGMVRGGIASATSVLVPALAAQDDIDSVTVLHFHGGEASTDYRRDGPKVEVHYVRGQDRLSTITGSFLNVRKARKLVAALKPDIVHGQALAGRHCREMQPELRSYRARSATRRDEAVCSNEVP